MKHWWKIALILFLGLVLLFTLRKCDRDDPKVIVTTPLPDSAVYWRNINNELIASQKGLIERFAVIQDKIIDSLSKVFSTKISQIETLQIINFEGTTQIPVKPGKDSTEYGPVQGNCPPQIKSMSDVFENPWYTAQVKLGEGRSLKLDTRDTLVTVWKEVKEGKKNYLQVDMKFSDPSKKVVGVQSYRRLIPEKVEKQLSLYAQAKTLFIDRNLYPMAGLGLNRSTRYFDFGITGGKEFLNNSFYGEAHFNIKLVKFK